MDTRTLSGKATYRQLLPLLLKAALHAHLPDAFESVLVPFYDKAFHSFYVRQSKNEADDSMDDSTADLDCEGCNASEGQLFLVSKGFMPRRTIARTVK